MAADSDRYGPKPVKCSIFAQPQVDAVGEAARNPFAAANSGDPSSPMPVGPANGCPGGAFGFVCCILERRFADIAGQSATVSAATSGVALPTVSALYPKPGRWRQRRRTVSAPHKAPSAEAEEPKGGMPARREMLEVLYHYHSGLPPKAPDDRQPAPVPSVPRHCDRRRSSVRDEMLKLARKAGSRHVFRGEQREEHQ